MIAGDQRTAWKPHRDITAVGGCDFKLSNVWKLVIIASVTQEDLIHHELCRRPHILADVECTAIAFRPTMILSTINCVV